MINPANVSYFGEPSDPIKPVVVARNSVSVAKAIEKSAKTEDLEVVFGEFRLIVALPLIKGSGGRIFSIPEPLLCLLEKDKRGEIKLGLSCTNVVGCSSASVVVNEIASQPMECYFRDIVIRTSLNMGPFYIVCGDKNRMPSVVSVMCNHVGGDGEVSVSKRSIVDKYDDKIVMEVESVYRQSRYESRGVLTPRFKALVKLAEEKILEHIQKREKLFYQKNDPYSKQLNVSQGQ